MNLTKTVNITLCLQAWVLEWEVEAEEGGHPVMDKNIYMWTIDWVKIGQQFDWTRTKLVNN